MAKKSDETLIQEAYEAEVRGMFQSLVLGDAADRAGVKSPGKSALKAADRFRAGLKVVRSLRDVAIGIVKEKDI